MSITRSFQILVVLMVLFVSFILVSYVNSVFAQTFPATLKNIPTNSTVATFEGIVNILDLPNPGNTTKKIIIPFHPIDPGSYEVEKKQAHHAQPVKSLDASTPNVPAGFSPFKIFPGFDGIENTGWIPPDVALAVGPNHIVELVNGAGKIWTKQGTPLSTFSLSSFFSSGSNIIFDPKIFYDPLSGRFFASVTDNTANSVLVAVSTTSDPTGSWNNYNISFGSNCPDQPKIAVSNSIFVVAANDFADHCNGSFQGGHFITIYKNQMTSGSADLTGFDFGADPFSGSITPVHSLSSTSNLFMVENLGFSVRLYTISDSSPDFVTWIDRSIINSIVPPGASQAGTPAVIDTGDNRVQDADFYQGKLWAALNDSCIPFGDTESRSCIHLIKMDTSTEMVLQDFRISSPNYYYFYPAIGIDGTGNLDLVFGFSSSSAGRYPSIAASGQSINDSPNTIQAPQTLKEGSQPNLDFRHGDYFGAAVDPSDTSRVWVGGEYYATPSFFSPPWSTWINKINVNTIPNANAGIDQVVNERKLVNLDGSGSSDPDSDTLSYSWTQTAGPAVTLSNVNSANPTFTTPLVNSNTVLTFNLVVNDGFVNSNPDAVSFIVQNNDCVLPSLGDWIITQSCTLRTSFNELGNVMVQNNSVLTIDFDGRLNLDFKAKHLLVKSGSGVLIKPGGKISPLIYNVTPATNAFINSITTSSDVSYTLSGNIVSGSITMTRTGGTEDGSSPHLCTLTGTALNSGVHANLNLADTTNGCTVAQSLVSGTVYTFTFNVGSPAAIVTRTGVTFDTTAPSVDLFTTALNPTNISPIPVTATFSEAVTGFALGDIIVTNGVASNFAGGPIVYTFAVTPSGQGVVSIGVNADVATDLAGNGNTGAITLGRTFDTAAPAAPVITTADGTTNDNTPTIDGTTEDGTTVELFDDTTSLGLATVTGTNWTFTSAALSDATHSITAKATDAATNTSEASNTLSLTIDTTAPAAPVITTADGTTADNTPTIDGTTEDGTTVELFDGVTSLGSATVTGTSWTFTSPVLSDGTHSITARASDAVANTSVDSNTLSLTINTS